MKYLADEQKAVLAARDLLHHPLRAVTHDAETSEAHAPASPYGAAWGHGQHGSDDALHEDQPREMTVSAILDGLA